MSKSMEQLRQVAQTCFNHEWQVERTDIVPAPEDLTLNGTHAKDLQFATVLYADLDGSTDMVDTYHWWFSAGVYKAYLACAADIIRGEGGVITSYDGDRVMAVFTGANQCSDAVRAAMKITYVVGAVIQTVINAKYPDSGFVLRQTVGVDASSLHAARIGVRGDNDIVWVGRAANWAAKLTALPGRPVRITKAVFDLLAPEFIIHEGLYVWHVREEAALGGGVHVFDTDYIYTME